MDNVIPILSLVVAALAVLFGPLISWWTVSRQVGSSLEIANKQIIAPMRQAWINNLRDILAELFSSTHHYYLAGFDERSDKEYQRLELLEQKIQLMLNPKEADHIQLEKVIRRMISAVESGKDGDRDFTRVRPEVVELSRQILKREWNVVQERIQPQ